MALPPVFIEFIGSYAGLKVAADGVKKEIAEVDAESAGSMESFARISTAALLGIVGAATAVTYETVKMAIGFQQAMTQISTQAGVPKSQLAGLSNDVLNLAGQVGFSPDSLAEALYHVESSFASIGIKAPQAMELVKIAAQGAAVGGSDLVETQNALDAAVASGIPGAQNFAQAMGNINAAVGSGDMQMQDYVEALSNGVLAVVKGYGLTLTDVNAALAVYGDNNIRGANAATDLRMAVQALAVPAKAGATLLQQLGLQQDSLAKDMQTGGLNKAVTDLQHRFIAAGITGNQVGAAITTLFGKKAGSGLAVLMGQYDRLESKYPELVKSANGFTGAVAQQNDTIAQKVKDLEATFEAIGIRIGTMLLPYVSRFLGDVNKAVGFLQSHTGIFKTLAAGVGLLTAALAILKIEMIAVDIATDSNPFVALALAVVALGAGIYYAYTHFKGFRDVVSDVVHALEVAYQWFDKSVIKSKWLATAIQDTGHIIMTAWNACWKFVAGIINWFVANPLNFIMNNVKLFEKFWANHGKDIMQIAKAAWGVISAVVEFYLKFILNYLKFSLSIVESLWKIVWGIVSDTIKTVWHLISNIISIGIKFILDIVSAFLDLLHGRWSKLWNDTMKIFGDLFTGLAHLFNQFAQDAVKLLWDAGVNIIKGLVKGIESGFGLITSTMKNAGHLVTSAFHSIMGIFSPSRVMYQSGTYVWQGLDNALKDGQVNLHASAKNMGVAIQSGFNSSKNVQLGNMVSPTPGLGTMGGISGGMVQNIVQLEVQGHVLTDNDLRDLIQQELLRLDGRNTGSYLTAKV
jgi:TP901 family phage tail tape measure protein